MNIAPAFAAVQSAPVNCPPSAGNTPTAEAELAVVAVLGYN